VGRLRWVLIGSGPGLDACGNTAVLLDRHSGEEIGRQGKRSRFNIDPDMVASWRMPMAPAALQEGVEPDPQITVFESKAGRYVISICEDLTRTRHDSILSAVGPSHVLVPIFSSEISPGRWEERAADSAARNIGATVVVSNSLVVPLARAAGGRISGAANTAMKVAPQVDDYPSAPQFGAAKVWDAIVAFEAPVVALPSEEARVIAPLPDTAAGRPARRAKKS